MDKLFPSVDEARKSLRETEKNLPEKIKNELLTELPGRLSRNILRGDYYINHILNRFPVFHTKYYVAAVKEVEKLLIAEGYHVESYVIDYNGYYNQITMLISWDINSVLNDEFLSKEYKKATTERKSIKIV